MNVNESLFEQLIEGENILVMERGASGRFKIIGRPPAWAAQLDGGKVRSGEEIDPAAVFVFLVHFLEEAAAVWQTAGEASLMSPLWTEHLAGGDELTFTALARSLRGRTFLLVRTLGVDFEERCKVLQKARELALDHERLLKETSKKETLLHCLVHDVVGPLTTVSSCFSLLETQEGLTGEGRALLELGRSETHRQHVMLREMLDLFSAEVTALEKFARDAASAPDVLECAHSVAQRLRYSFQVKGVAFNFSVPAAGNGFWKVVGQPGKLERVLYNLIDNGLRHTPPGSAVTLRLKDEAHSVRVAIEDQGEGLDASTASQLFKPFQQGRRAIGKAGLGLYFCRTMIERWGGEIGGETAPQGGASFWFRLAKPEPA